MKKEEIKTQETADRTGGISTDERELTSSAHEEAEHDMEEDPELSEEDPDADLDEGEIARKIGDRQDDI